MSPRGVSSQAGHRECQQWHRCCSHSAVMEGHRVTPHSRRGRALRFADIRGWNRRTLWASLHLDPVPLSPLCVHLVRYSPWVSPGLPLRWSSLLLPLFLTHSDSPSLSVRVRSGCQQAGEGTDLNPAVEFGASNCRRRGVVVSQGDGCLLRLLTL